MTSIAQRILASPSIYLLWQRPFARQKLVPLLRGGSIARARRVLDVGCGPGTNARYFAHADYHGIDLSPEYIEFARRKFARDFEVADVTRYTPEPGSEFDFVLMNSLLHHIDDAGADHILRQVARMLAPEGRVHILDLVLPERRSIARRLALADRGDFPRPLEGWRELFRRHFAEETFEPYQLGIGGLALWQMVYFAGERRDED